MKRATLVVNPAAGRAAGLRAALPTLIGMLGEHGYAVEVVETTPSERWSDAFQVGCDLVIACGGDGTIHSVVQALAAEKSQVPLGVIPAGTANALAWNLGLPDDPVAALARLMTYRPRSMPLGLLTTSSQRRWFCLMAGCGPAGMLVHAMAGGSKLKARFGRSAYYAHAARLFVTRRWPVFRVEYRTADGGWEQVDGVAMMASWVADLGGFFAGVTTKARGMDGRLRVQVVRGPAWLALPAWMLLGTQNAWVDEVEVEELRCAALDERAVYVQADAEPMGALPFSLRVVPDALTMLMPEPAAAKLGED